MKFSTSHTFFALLLALLSSSTFPLAMYADNKIERTGAFRRDNINLNRPDYNRPNVNIYRPDINIYRPNYNPPNVNVYRPDINVNRPDYNRPNVNIYRPDINVNRPDYNRPNVNIYRPDINVNRPDYNRPNVNVYRPDINVNRPSYNRPNVNVYRPNYNHPKNIGSRGGGWYGNGYSTPLGWGLLTFASGLALGSVINSPPYYSPVTFGRNNYIYSDGVFLEPRDSFYVVIKPPIGAIVPLIPQGCTALNTSGVGYYNCSSVIYQPFYQDRNLVYKVISY